MSEKKTGLLRHRVLLEQAEPVDDGGGGFDRDWREVARLWAAIRPIGGRDLLMAGKLASRITHEVTLRYRPGVLPEMRLRKGGRIFHILAVHDADERRRWLRVLCEERE